MTIEFHDPDLLTEAERKTLPAATYYASVHDIASPPERAYLDALSDARLGILHRVVGNLLREPLDELPTQVVTSVADEAVPAERFPFSLSEDGSSTFRELQPLPDDCQHLAFVPFPKSAVVLAIPLASVHGFDRFRPTGRPKALDSEAVRSVLHPLDLVALLDREGCVTDSDERTRFETELDESVANLALAYLGRRVLVRQSPGEDASLESLLRGVGGADRLAALERLAAIEERPTNPSAKIRRGMSATDSLVYASEFTDSVEVRFVGIHRNDVAAFRSEASDGLTEYLCSRFDGLEAALHRSLPTSRDAEEYVVVPIHPWQYHQVLGPRLERLQAEGRVVPVTGFTQSASPLLNLRTLVPHRDDGSDEYDEEHLPHLKLSIGVQKTSSVRTIPPVEIHDGPRLTDLFHRLRARESFDSLGFLGEPIAARFDGSVHESSADDGFLEGHLSALIRTNPYCHPLVDDGADPVTAASLLADVPRLGQPLVCEVIDRFAESRDTTDPADATYAFLDSYLETFVDEQLRLLGKYGIALDMHLQNVCVVFDEDYRPTASLFRDFGGIRIVTNRLESHGFRPELHPESPIDASERAAHRNVVHSTLQTHVGELIGTLVHHGDVAETECWNRVRRQYRDALESVQADDAVRDSWLDSDGDVLFGDTTFHNSRIEMRLKGTERAAATSEVSNPLADGFRFPIEGRSADEHTEN